MEFAVIELEFDVEAFLDAHLHFDGSVGIGFGANISHDEFLLFSNPIVISIDNNIDVVSQINYYAIVSLKLLLDPIELKIVRDIVCQSTWGLKVSDNLQKSRVLILVIEIFNNSN
jgi:hypothetical protein